MNEILGTVEIEKMPTEGDPLSHIQFDNSHFTIGTKVEKSLIQFHKRKIPSTEKIVYHFLALDWYWNKQANKHHTKQ